MLHACDYAPQTRYSLNDRRPASRYAECRGLCRMEGPNPTVPARSSAGYGGQTQGRGNYCKRRWDGRLISAIACIAQPPPKHRGPSENRSETTPDIASENVRKREDRVTKAGRALPLETGATRCPVSGIRWQAEFVPALYSPILPPNHPSEGGDDVAIIRNEHGSNSISCSMPMPASRPPTS